MPLTTTRKPVYTVVTFSKAKGGVTIDAPRQAQGEKSAIRMAERLSTACIGAIAISRVGDVEVGEFDEPVEVARFGTVPPEYEQILLGF